MSLYVSYYSENGGFSPALPTHLLLFHFLPVPHSPLFPHQLPLTFIRIILTWLPISCMHTSKSVKTLVYMYQMSILINGATTE